MQISLFETTLKNLKDITKNCNDEMHEPDNQGILARVIGNHLDNAMGDTYNNCGEYIVIITDENTGKEKPFSLASLIALAKMAKLDDN